MAVLQEYLLIFAQRLIHQAPAFINELLGPKAFYIFMAAVFAAALEIKAGLCGPGGLRRRLAKIIEECAVYAVILAMSHGIDATLGLEDAFRRAASAAILSEKILAALKAASIMGYSKITNALEDVYGNLIHREARSSLADSEELCSDEHQEHGDDAEA